MQRYDPLRLRDQSTPASRRTGGVRGGWQVPNRFRFLFQIRAALVHGSGLCDMMVVLGPRPGVATHEVPEAESVEVREVPIPDSQLA
jgi:hypothetical protein